MTTIAPLDAHQFESAFGAFLVNERIVEPNVVERAISAGQKTGERLDRVLTKLGLVSETDLATSLSKYLAVPIVAAADIPPAPVLPDVIEPDYVHRARIMPLAATGDTLTLGVVDPLDAEPARALAYLTERDVAIRIFVPAEFDKAFDALYATAANAQDSAVASGAEAGEHDVQRLRDMASEAPIPRLVRQVSAGAVETRASDIHTGPSGTAVLVRYRIDGVLRTVQTLAGSLRAAITSRVKIMSKLDIAERRMPQDGRIKIAVR